MTSRATACRQPASLGRRGDFTTGDRIRRKIEDAAASQMLIGVVFSQSSVRSQEVSGSDSQSAQHLIVGSLRAFPTARVASRRTRRG